MYDRFQRIGKDDYWKISICSKCNALVYGYKTKVGGIVDVSVVGGFEFNRRGNNNNYVPHHNCGDSMVERKKIIRIDCLEVPDEIKEAVPHYLQQQAVVIALDAYSGKNIRSPFKKSMLKQAKDFLAGESKYKRPYSPAQALAIVLLRERRA